MEFIVSVCFEIGSQSVAPGRPGTPCVAQAGLLPQPPLYWVLHSDPPCLASRGDS